MKWRDSGAEITLARVDNFEDLNAETKEKGHEKV